MTADQVIAHHLGEADRLFENHIQRLVSEALVHPEFDGDIEALDRRISEARAQWVLDIAKAEYWMRQCLDDLARSRREGRMPA